MYFQILTYTNADIVLLSVGGAHDASITCIAGNVTPPPKPSPIRIAIMAM